jgi:heptaprenyl diphosphate synthase
MKNTRKMVFMAVLTALGVVLGIVDRTISAQITLALATTGVPPLVHLRLGLANIVILLSILNFSFSESFLMATLKSLLVSLILGQITTFIYGYSGTVLSFLVMWSLLKITRGKLNIIVVSFFGSITHLFGQLVAVFFVLTGGSMFGLGAIIANGLLMLPASLVTGVLIGMIVKNVRSYVDRTRVFQN